MQHKRSEAILPFSVSPFNVSDKITGKNKQKTLPFSMWQPVSNLSILACQEQSQLHLTTWESNQMMASAIPTNQGKGTASGIPTNQGVGTASHLILSSCH